MSERRIVEVVDRRPRPAGQTTVDLECPFCGVVMQARSWALAGSGKRCDCGALLWLSAGRYGATKDGAR